MNRQQRAVIVRVRDACDAALNAENHAAKYLAGIELAEAVAALIAVGQAVQAKQREKASV